MLMGSSSAPISIPPKAEDPATQKQAPPKSNAGPWYSRILCCTGKEGDKAISNNIVGKGLLTNAGVIEHEQVLSGQNEVGKGLLKNANIDTTKNGQTSGGN